MGRGLSSSSSPSHSRSVGSPVVGWVEWLSNQGGGGGGKARKKTWTEDATFRNGGRGENGFVRSFFRSTLGGGGRGEGFISGMQGRGGRRDKAAAATRKAVFSTSSGKEFHPFYTRAY